MSNKKDHLLWSPKKNYLGSWDLHEDKDLVLTIKSGGYENVKDPSNGKSEDLKVVHFVEKDYKPLICNATNSMRILLATGLKKWSQFEGQNKKICLYIDQTRSPKLKMMVDCVRVRPVTVLPEKPTLEDKDIKGALAWILKNKTGVEGFKKIRKVTPKQEKELERLIKEANEKD